MKDEALKILERLDGLSKDRYVGSLLRALVWTGLGEKNKALENLEKAYQERESAHGLGSRFGPFLTACARSQGSKPCSRK